MSCIIFFRREFLSDSVLWKVLNKSFYNNYSRSCIIKRNYSFKSASELKTNHEDYIFFKELKNNFREKVIYHSFYKYEDFSLQIKKEIERKKSEEKRLSRISLAPASLKYILEDDNKSCLTTNEQKDELTKNEEPDSVVLPYNVSKVKVSGTDDVHFNKDECNLPENVEESVNCLYKETDIHNLIKDNSKTTVSKKWMRDYDMFEEEDDSDEELLKFNKQSEYGTPDSSIPMSNVPCGGCGALLHCQDPGIPGYLPSEIFSSCHVQELRSITCQRCHFMKNYNTALSVSVDPEYYPRLLSKIKNEEALVILLVDMTDFPCSIWPGILNIIGRKRPLFLIGNKIDLIVGDRKGWIRRAKESLQAAVPKSANVIYTSLISAKTGFGVEDLINNLYNLWEYRGDVYLVGCTNVGKSTLFNALLQSDYCKVKAVDLLQRATTAPWPGTTMNLLKFPILRPSGVRLFLRTRRLQEEKLIKSAEKRLWKMQNAPKKQIEPVQLVGHIGHSFCKRSNSGDIPDPFLYNAVRKNELPESGLNPNDKDFKRSKWFYDTPGVVHSAQIIDLLTTDELMQTLPKEPILHRVFIFKQNWTVFIAGLGRMDFIKLTNNTDGGDDFIKIVIFCPETLPVTICETEKADAIYNEYVGTPMFVVPSGGKNRLKVWPPMKSSDDIILQGISDESCADIVLSNAGWISIRPNEEQLCKFRCWTPDGRGIYVRKVPLMKYAATVHGKRIRKTPAYCRRYLKEAGSDR